MKLRSSLNIGLAFQGVKNNLIGLEILSHKSFVDFLPSDLCNKVSISYQIEEKVPHAFLSPILGRDFHLIYHKKLVKQTMHK